MISNELWEAVREHAKVQATDPSYAEAWLSGAMRVLLNDSDAEFILSVGQPVFVDDDLTYGGEDHLSDVEADAMTLASAGMGTDEDYGFYGDYDGEY